MEYFKGTTIRSYLQELDRSQWLKPDEIRALQDKKLRALVRHAYDHIPYYRKVFQNTKLTPEDIRTQEDLKKLPFLTKQIIRDNFQDLVDPSLIGKKSFINHTSGSTGEPLKYYISMDGISISWASGYRGWGWGGYRLGDKRVTLALGSSQQMKLSYGKKMRFFLERNLALTTVNMTEDRMRSYSDQIRTFQPAFIRGYPSALYVFALFLRKEDITGIEPRAIFTTAETLYPYQRKFIEETFGCSILDTYGCRDGGANAMQCGEHDGYHIGAEQCILEVMRGEKETGSGEWGEIVTTDLHNYVMPFIRYRTGDVAETTDSICSCGRGLPLLKKIQGRLIGLVRDSQGNILSGLPLTDIFEYMEQHQHNTIKQYHVIQDKNSDITVKLVKGEYYSDADDMRIIDDFKIHLGNRIRIRIEYVNDIPLTKSGKRLYVISDISEL